MDKQIVSRFYLITIDNDPIYVGFTNRPISVRFREHKHDKELPDNARVQEIDKLVYDFSWDMVTVNNNAKEVSDREAELIKEYNTQDSIYQKAIGGGRVWNEIKHFIIINREDPFWQSMPEDIILATIEKTKMKKARMTDLISHTKDSRRLENLIYNTSYNNRLRDLIRHTNNTSRIENLIYGTTIVRRIKNVITNTNNEKRLNHVINDTKTSQRLERVVYNTVNDQRLRNLIVHTRLK